MGWLFMFSIILLIGRKGTVPESSISVLNILMASALQWTLIWECCGRFYSCVSLSWCHRICVMEINDELSCWGVSIIYISISHSEYKYLRVEGLRLSLLLLIQMTNHLLSQTTCNGDIKTIWKNVYTWRKKQKCANIPYPLAQNDPGLKPNACSLIVMRTCVGLTMADPKEPRLWSAPPSEHTISILLSLKCCINWVKSRGWWFSISNWSQRGRAVTYSFQVEGAKI